MKYIILVGDGMSDRPCPDLNGKTPLEVAAKPEMDALCLRAEMGQTRTIPGALPAGSDTANLSLMGYDPAAHYTGRSPLEAVSMGVEMGDRDLVFRCNLVHVTDEPAYEARTMVSHSAGMISQQEAEAIMKDLIFHVGEKDALLHQLERLGFMTTCTMAALCISLHMPHGTEEYVRESRHLKMVAESCAKRIHDQYISFEYREKRILLLINYTPEDLEQYLDSLFKTASAHKLLPLISIGVGDIVKGPENQDSNFMHAYAACKLASRKKERILYYKEMGIYKLLIDNENTEALTAFYTDSVGKLKEYDEKNNTEYETFVKMYVACDGHQGEVSEKCFIHRNTVNNYVKKAEEIMGIDLSSWEGKARLYVALCVEDIL